MTLRAEIAAAYRRFSAEEARGRSALYETLSLQVAEDIDVLGFLLSLPSPKRQPNLLLAAVRHLHGTLGWPGFRDAILGDPERLRALMCARATQTNEPARCAALLPILAALPQPLALIEVGASAGLCLIPDRYGYDYGQGRLGAAAPVFPCIADAATPIPDRLPTIAWRAGLDLNPIDLAQAEDAAWLEILVWPEQEERLARLRAAIPLAVAERPRIVQGDLRRDLPKLVAQAPAGATRVIFHTPVLAYVEDQAERDAFGAQAMALGDVWICNEAPRTMPTLAASTGPGPIGRFLVSVNGRPTAWADPHGAAIDWIG
jgi:hypothetical protein